MAIADRILAAITVTTYRISAGVVLLMAGATVFGVMTRQLLHRPMVDTVLIGQLSVSTMTFLGLAWVFRQHRHIAAGVVVERLPPRWGWRLHLAGLIVALATVLYVIPITWNFAYSALTLGERLVGMQSVPAFPFQVLIPAGFALLALEISREILLLIRQREARMHGIRGYD